MTGVVMDEKDQRAMRHSAKIVLVFFSLPGRVAFAIPGPDELCCNFVYQRRSVDVALVVEVALDADAIEYTCISAQPFRGVYARPYLIRRLRPGRRRRGHDVQP